MALQPGEILDGKYRIVRIVGEGGMGAVYEGENTRIKRKVAIKVLHAAVAEKQDVVQRFEREAQAAGRIGSEHIVEVLDLGNLPSGERYMVMEFLEGEDLTGRIKRYKRLTPEQCFPLLDQVLEGLAAAHDASIVHRDLKPDNIFILSKHAGRTDFVKILDFGVSKFSALDDQMSMTRTGAVMGTPYYMSPEQAKGGTIDGRSDLYAIGVVAYQMVTGRVPFNAGSFNELLFKIVLESPEPIEQLVPGLDPQFIGIVNRAMSREPEHRFQSAREFQTALKQWRETAQPGATDADGLLPPPMSRALGASNPNLRQSGSGYAQTPAGLGGTPVPGAYPMRTPGGGTPLGSSQAALAVTPAPARNSGTLVLLGVVGTLILGAGGVGAYILTRPSSAHAKTVAATTSKPSASKADVKPAMTVDPIPTSAPEKTAEPQPTAAPSASTSASATKVSTHEPPPPTGKIGAKASASAKPPPPPASSAKPPPPTTTVKGRNIKTDL